VASFVGKKSKQAFWKVCFANNFHRGFNDRRHTLLPGERIEFLSQPHPASRAPIHYEVTPNDYLGFLSQAPD